MTSTEGSDVTSKGIPPPVGTPAPDYMVAPPPTGVPPPPAQGTVFPPPSSPMGYPESPAQGVAMGGAYADPTVPKGYPEPPVTGYAAPPQAYPPAGYPPPMMTHVVPVMAACQHDWREGNPTTISWVIAFGVCFFTCLPCGFIAPLVMKSRICVKCGLEIDK
eukprot:TRINITY_DN3412_c3_g1_i1.p1 TRINITY_DN3412_c3_g1~~TRINITY_DN3412_c3_g1_i1.p1  ORF type:complete len:162 (+),score=13.38 TRINITY_DN3412_c3_g1_i1:80-565(+)